MKAREVLREALELVDGDRADTYGSGPATFPIIARLWSDHFRCVIKPTDVAIAMILVKVARLAQDESRGDTWIDIAGYAALGAEAAGAEK